MTFWVIVAAVVLSGFTAAGFKLILELPSMALNEAKRRDAGPGITLTVLLVLESIAAFFTASAVYFLLMLTGYV